MKLYQILLNYAKLYQNFIKLREIESNLEILRGIEPTFENYVKKQTLQRTTNQVEIFKIM